MAEKNKTIMVVVSITVLVILAVAFLSAISDQTAVNTQKTVILNESHTLTAATGLVKNAGGGWNISSSGANVTVTNAPTGWKQEDCPLTSVAIYNGTGTALTLTTDYIIYADTGVIGLKDTIATVNLSANKTFVDYAYCGDNYVSSSWGRTLLTTNVGIYAVAILVAVVLVVYLLFNKKEDD